MIAVMPNVNLVSNIGFGLHSTHTQRVSMYSGMPTESMMFPLRHPDVVRPDDEADRFTARSMFAPSLPRRVMAFLRKRIG